MRNGIGRVTLVCLVLAGMVPAAETPVKAGPVATGTDNTDALTIPQLINFQGRLTDAAGKPRNGTFNVTFKLYDGTSCYWDETQPGVVVTDGLFNVLLGSVVAIPSMPEDGACSLEVVVAGEAIAPKVPLVSVPYAYSADRTADAEKLGGVDALVYLKQGSAAGGDLAGTYPGPTIARKDAEMGQVLKWTGSTWQPSDDLMGVVGSGTANCVPRWTGAGALGNSIVYQTGDRIGIGTATPNADAAVHIRNNSTKPCLYVEGTEWDRNFTGTNPDLPAYATVIYSDFARYGMGQVYGALGFVSHDNNPVTGGNIQFYTGNSFYGYPSAERLRMDYRGNIGVGTTTPAAKLHVVGDFLATGSKSAVVKTSGGDVALYCQESPENWFEDFGEGKLVNGHARIELDRLFLETVTIDERQPMKVFIQLRDDCAGVYVTKGSTGFEVRELGNGTSNAAFDWRVVAKRRGFEDRRFERVNTGQ